MRKIIWFLMLVFFVSACSQTALENKPPNAKPTQTAITTNPATPAPLVSPTHPKNGNYDGKGVVTKINLELVSVELNHEEIKGLMPAMIMELYVKEKKELEVLKVGDKVEFVVEYKDGQEKIISIKKIQ